MYFQSVLTDKVHQPLATVRVVPLYQMCGRVAYFCVAFLPHIAKVCENWVGSVNFVVFRALGKNYQLISQKLHFPRPKSSLKKNILKNCRAKSQRMYFQSVLTDKVHQPLSTVRVVPLYQMCGRVAYLCVAFLPHIAKVCEKFVNFWMDFFCTNPAIASLSPDGNTLALCQKNAVQQPGTKHSSTARVHGSGVSL